MMGPLMVAAMTSYIKVIFTSITHYEVHNFLGFGLESP